MTSEQNVPEVQSCQDSMGETAQQDNDAATNGQSGPNGMGQSKSSRRRRRKRRSKGIDASSGQLGFENQPEVQIQASQAPQPSGGQPNYGGAQQQQQGPGGKRWKKKFRRGQHAGGSGAESGYRGSDTHQPGNTTHRRGKGGKQQKAQRGFVGPMDHSYREVNGNFADAPPSTIETGNYARNGHGSSRAAFFGDSGPIDYSVGRAIPVDENAPVRIYFFIEDLFFLAKIQETARKLGVKIAFPKNDKESLAQITSSKDEDRPGLIVFDLNNVNAKPLTLIPKLKTKLKKGTSIVGFLSHIQGDLKAKAVEAGCDTVLSRAAFSQNLPNLLRRYGAVEEDEANYNQ